MKAISEILFAAGINALDGIQRMRVSADDASGPATDYLDDQPVTNDLGVLTPYQVTFRGFSAEIARVLGGFAAAPHGFIVKTIKRPAGRFNRGEHRRYGWKCSYGRGGAGGRNSRLPACRRRRARRGARRRPGPGRIAGGAGRTIVERHAEGRSGEIDAEKLNAWNSSRKITRRSF